MKTIVIIILWAAIAGGCNAKKTIPLFTEGIPLGKVDQRLEEASGLAASRNNPGLLWTINDSGNPPEVFLIDHQARIKMICTLSKAHNRDWEDIAIGAGPDPGKNYVYVADIGDNLARYDFKLIYRFEEPVLSTQKKIMITRFDTLVFKMPDGKRDTETILIDPVTHDLYLVSKREPLVALYMAPYPFSHDTVTLRKIMTLPFTNIVAGNISDDGQQVLLKDYDNIYYWKKLSGESWEALLTRNPIALPYEREPQGEAITWSLDGKEFYTLSEGSRREHASLFVHRKKFKVESLK